MSGNVLRVCQADKAQLRDFLTRTLRYTLLRQASAQRSHLQGALHTDLVVTTHHLRRPCELELILILCDGVWTQHLKSKMSEEGDEVCPLRPWSQGSPPTRLACVRRVDIALGAFKLTMNGILSFRVTPLLAPA